MGLGNHVLADFYDCHPSYMNDRDLIEKVMVEAAIHCGATVVESAFHQFNPIGISGVVVIAESHLTIHTWPEYNFASIDVYTCGEQLEPMDAIKYLEDKFGAKQSEISRHKRGALMRGPHKTEPSLMKVEEQS